MANTNITIKAQKRGQASKGALRKLREAGFVPAIVYGRNGSESLSVLSKSLPKEHTRANIIDIDIDGQAKRVLMRDVQVNPINDQLVHIDFQEVVGDEVIKVKVPLEYVGLTREQEKEGSFKILIRALEVKATASRVPASLPVAIGQLRAGDTVHAADLKLPEGVKAVSQRNLALASLVKL